MKAVLFFALLVASISADFIPNWFKCEGVKEFWKPLTLSLSQEPAYNTKETMHACGRAMLGFTVTSFKYTLWYELTEVVSGTIALKQEDLPGQTYYCFDQDFFIPVITKGTYKVIIDIQDTDYVSVGCFTFFMNLYH